MTRLEENIHARFAKLEADIDDRFATVDARFNKLAENQQEIALTLARLVALLEAGENQCGPVGLAGQPQPGGTRGSYAAALAVVSHWSTRTRLSAIHWAARSVGLSPSP